MTRKTILLFACTLLYAGLRAQTAVSDDEALKAGRRIGNATKQQRADQLRHFIDPPSFMHEMAKTCKELKDPTFRKGFEETFLPSIPKLGAQLAEAGDDPGGYRLLREYDSNGIKHLLFRGLGDNGLTYHDFTLVKVRDSIKAADVYLYTSGENFSVTMGNLVTIMAASSNLDKASGRVKALVSMRGYLNSKQYDKAKEVYDGLDEGMREDKGVQILYIGVARNLNDSVYQDALENFQRLFPDAPNTYVMMLDLYYLRKEYQKGMDAVDKLDKMVADPMLNLFRGNYVLLSGKNDECIPYYEKAYQYDPGCRMNTKTLIIAYARAGRSEDARKVITEFRQGKSFVPGDLDDVYAAFPKLK